MMNLLKSYVIILSLAIAFPSLATLDSYINENLGLPTCRKLTQMLDGSSEERVRQIESMIAVRKVINRGIKSTSPDTIIGSMPKPFKDKVQELSTLWGNFNSASQARRAALAPASKVLPIQALEKSCPLCAGKNMGISDYPDPKTDRYRGLRIEWCLNDACQFGFVLGLNNKELSDYYRGEYTRVFRPKVNTLSAPEFFATMQEGRVAVRSNFHVNLLERAGAAFEQVLDFGAGVGMFFHAAKRGGRRVGGMAIELDEGTQKYYDHLRIRRVTSFDQARPGSFDVVVSSHSLEHLLYPDLKPTIDKLVARTKIGGFLCIEVPLASPAKLGEKHPHEPHTLFFSKAAFRNLFESRRDLEVLNGLARPTDPKYETREQVVIARRIS